MQVTPNLGLNKPEGNDVANIEVLNANTDIIDKEIKQVKDDIQNIEIPTSLPANGGDADTVDGKHANEFISTSGGAIGGAGNGIAFNGKSQKNGIYATNGDGAAVGQGPDKTNLAIQSWQGVGFVNGCPNDGILDETTVAIDCRSGNITAKGNIVSNGFNLSENRFKTLSERGFNDSQFSTTDVGDNMYKIFYAIPNYSACMDNLNATTKFANLYNSILAKAKTDLGLTIFNGNEFIVKFEKGNGTNLPNLITIMDNGTFKEYKFIYDRDGTNNKMSKMYQTFGEGIGGDIVGKVMKSETLNVSYEKNVYTVLKSYSNSKGGMARIHAMSYNTNRNIPVYKLVVDGVTVFQDTTLLQVFGANTNGYGAHFLDIPFKSSFILYYKDSYGALSTTVSISYYLNS